MERLHHRLELLFPKAKQVFALSTAVVEEKYKPPYQRYNKDIEQFNEIAIKTLSPLGVKINDLYTLTKNASEECRSDMTHFYTPVGIKLVGDKVLDCICDELDIPLSQVKDVSATVPTLSKEIVGR